MSKSYPLLKLYDRDYKQTSEESEEDEEEEEEDED
ncbi:hypothetical protein A2U01_0087854 [Trifolium medium]|uniref:Uncharacterized protein n=1 Tax=Trifolium medium TaxID=97028 RepID=A0A392U2H3_9FABA|nr:hypothetical protein [Trifolium medium]